MRAILALSGTTALGAVLSLWLLLEWRGEVAATRSLEATVAELREARQHDASILERQSQRAGTTITSMATACRGEGDDAFDRGYNLGVARCGLPPQF